MWGERLGTRRNFKIMSFEATSISFLEWLDTFFDATDVKNTLVPFISRHLPGIHVDILCGHFFHIQDKILPTKFQFGGSALKKVNTFGKNENSWSRHERKTRVSRGIPGRCAISQIM